MEISKLISRLERDQLRDLNDTMTELIKITQVMAELEAKEKKSLDTNDQ